MKILQIIIGQFKNILGKLGHEDSLKIRVILGSMWLGAGSSAEQGLRFLRNIILTRLLAPEAFGVMAIILAFKLAVESITNVGVKQAIIQNPKGGEQIYLNGAWCLAFGRALIIYALAYFGSPWISRFYSNQELISLIRVTFLSIILEGALSSRAYVAVKQMNFKQWMIISHGGGACGVIITILIAFAFKNIWALVLGITIEAAIRCILSYIVCPFLPRLKFDKALLRALLEYARGMFGLGLLYFIYMQADVFVIGKLCPPSDLGLYSMAVALAQIPFQLIATLMGQIALPAFSEIQTDKVRINKLIMNLSSLIAYLCFPILFFVCFNGKELLTLVYGSQYAKVARPFAIIFGSWLLRFSSVPIAELYYALGRPELQRLFTAIRAGMIILLIYPAIKWFGLIGAASAAFISMIVGNIFQIYRLRGIINLNLKQYSTIFLRAIALSLPVIVTWITMHNICSINVFLTILPGVIGCILAYILVFWTFFMPRGKITSFIAVK